MQLVKDLIFSLFLVLPINVFGFFIGGQEDYPQAVIQASSTVYEVRTLQGKGTGFFIAPNLFVTSFHVVDSIQSIREISLYFDEELSPIRIKKLLAVSYPYDLALFKTRKKSSVYLSQGSLPDMTDQVFTIGYPDTHALQVHHSISSIRDWEGLFYGISFNFDEGMGASGSPVINSLGQFFGIMFGLGSKHYVIGSHWLELLKNGDIGIACQKSAYKCVQQEILRTKTLVQRFLSNQPVKKKSLGVIHITKDRLEGVLSNAEKETYLLEIAEEWNDPVAMYNLGNLLYEQGKLEEAEHWFKLSADHGDLGAMNNLGILLYEQGKLEEAEHWFKLATDQGRYLRAMNNLGVLLGKKDRLEEAEYWLKLAADQRHLGAMNNLRVLLGKKDSQFHSD